MESHRKLYKNSIGKDSGLNKRIRKRLKESKSKRDNKILKNRELCLKDNNVIKLDDSIIKVELLKLCNSLIICDDISVIIGLLENLKMLLINNLKLSLDIMKDNGIFILFLKLLDVDMESVHISISSILINAFCGENDIVKYLAEVGYIKVLVKLLNHSNLNVKENILWCIGNLCCLDSRYRVLFLSENGLRVLLDNIRCLSKLNELKLLSWTMKHICKDGLKYSVDLYLMLNELSKLFKYNDYEIIKNSCECLCNLVSVGYIKVLNLVDNGICIKLFEILSNKGVGDLDKTVLTIIGNLICSNDLDDIKLLLEHNLLDTLSNILVESSTDTTLKILILWMLSNISASDTMFVDNILKSSIIGITHNIMVSDIWKVQREAVWVICNCIYKGNIAHIEYVIGEGIIKSLSDLLVCDEIEILELILSTFEKLIKGNHDITKELEECNGLDKIEKLYNKNESLDKVIIWIIEQCESSNMEY